MFVITPHPIFRVSAWRCLFENMYRLLTQVVKRNVHCVKCFIRKMFCIISIFILFITFAEFPSNNKKALIIDFIKTLFFFKTQLPKHKIS